MLIQKHHLIGLFSLPCLILVCFFVAANPQVSFAAEKAIDYISEPVGHAGVIIDTHDAALCEAASLKGARCLPARDLLGPHKRLANFSGLLWLLGTAGLSGAEHVLVIGDQSKDKEFLAGVLYLAGQRKVSVLMKGVKSLQDLKLAPGTSRSKTRENVYRAAMRENLIVLRSELAHMLRSDNAPVILDGRSESEYLGQKIRASRGGHLPGAQHLPAQSLRPGKGKDDASPIHMAEGEQAIAYGHDSYESIVFLVRLAAAGLQTKVLHEGWVGWASDGSLPVDSASYPDLKTSPPPMVMARPQASKIGLPFIALIALAGIGLFAAGFFASRKFSRK